VDPTTRANRSAWEAASQKHVREYDELLAEAAAGSSLTDAERDLLREILARSPEVVHLQSGHGLDDVSLVRAGAKSVLGVDYSQVAIRAAQRRANELGVACRFGRSHVNDTFPARGAVEWQWTLGEVVTAVVSAGMEIERLSEYPEPFWRPGGVSAAAWNGRLPNSFALLARRRGA
jgi:hypothetical protein